jgi:hypothetical protein
MGGFFVGNGGVTEFLKCGPSKISSFSFCGKMLYKPPKACYNNSKESNREEKS